MHMLYDLTSVFRQSLEALPLPKASIPLMLLAVSLFYVVTETIAPYEKEWNEKEAIIAEEEGTEPRRFAKRYWPGQLHIDATPLVCAFHWTAVRACFGANGWKQTKDRSYYASDFQCKVDTYKEWSYPMFCQDGCGRSIARLFFNFGMVCEGCRLEKAIREQDNHLEMHVRGAIQALGYDERNISSTFPYYASTKEDSNIPYEALVPAHDGEVLFNTKVEFKTILTQAPKLQEFFRCLRTLDAEEQRVKFVLRSRVCARQLDNDYANPPSSLYTSKQSLDGCSAYRRTLTHEEFEQTDGKGWTPRNGATFCPW